MISNPLKWMDNAQDIIRHIRENQLDNLDKASDIVADSIGKGHVCFLFGSGHAAIPVMEMFPRYGTILGFMPIVDQPLVSFLRMVGDLGYPQFDFLENSPEYGKRILDNYRVHEEDCGVVFSHSGTTPVSVEVAIQIKNKGAKLIGVTSLNHANSVKARHPSGRKLHEIADIVIDTGVPAGDVSLTIDANGKAQRAGPLSTIAFVAIADSLVVGTIEKLSHRGASIETFPVRSLDPDAGAKMDYLLMRYRDLYRRHLAAYDGESR